MIPISSPSLSTLERGYLIEAFDSGWISSRGAFMERSEDKLCEVTSARHAAVVSNGTVALHLALRVAGVGAGDEVIMPSLSYVATLNAALYVGATPVLVDVDPVTWNVDPNAVAEAVTEKTRAVIAVDLYGNPANYAALRAVTQDRAIVLIADAAESIGATVDGRPTGNLAEISTFSFFGNKVITSGEGGAVTTNDPVLDAHIRQLRNQGSSLKRRYFHDVLGYNYRMTNLAAAILCGQLERLSELADSRRQVIEWYEARLGSCEPFRLQGVLPGVERSPWMMTVCVDGWSAEHRDEAIARLGEGGIETRPAFVPMQTMPHVHELANVRTPVAERIGREGISLPTFPGLRQDQVDLVCEALTRSVNS